MALTILDDPIIMWPSVVWANETGVSSAVECHLHHGFSWLSYLKVDHS